MIKKIKELIFKRLNIYKLNEIKNFFDEGNNKKEIVSYKNDFLDTILKDVEKHKKEYQ